MDAVNVAVVCGTISSEPRVRELPSGGTVTNVEVTTELDAGRVSVPVVVHDKAVTLTEGDVVVVSGHVARRFFRAGGVTQSRTELVARQIVPATHRRRVGRAIQAAVDQLIG
jgi:single-strand DNA-binding protein